MSSEGDNVKNVSSETNDKPATDTTDSSQDSQDVKGEKPEVSADAEKPAAANKDTASAAQESPEEKPKNDATKEPNKEEEEDKKKHDDVDNKDQDKDEKESNSKEGGDTEEGEESEKDDEDGSDKEEGKKKKKKPLLDQPLEQSGTRERKKVNRFAEEVKEKEATKVDVPSGNGTALGEIPRIDASISRFKNDDLRLLHKLLFKTPGKTAMIKKNIKKFNGFDFKKDTEEYNRKIASTQKFEVKHLKSICEMLDLEKKGNKEEITERIVDFLLEPKDSGKPVSGGRPKRSAAVKANNRGYTSHDDYSSDEKLATRSHRDKGKRSNLKDESSSESDEEFHPSDASDERPRTKRPTKRKKVESDEDETSDVEETASSEESDEPRSKRKRGGGKVANNKAKGKGTPGRRGRKPAANAGQKKKAASPKRGRRAAKDSSEEDSEAEETSSSEDEPLAKKAKGQPQMPTDDEIKTYVKEILEGANLEEITMKTVCKQVYAHYPDFDLSHKKDFIKTTVKSLIST